MRILPFKIVFLSSLIKCEIIWTCDQAADLCIFDRIFIPEEEICENERCLNEKKDLCSEYKIFDGMYDQFYCEYGPRNPHQVFYFIFISFLNYIK